jgi:NitT/TauT family transport system permease protein
MLVGMDLLLPSPLSVARALVRLAGTAAFWLSALGTLVRVFGGLALGCVLGAALAWLTYRSRWAEYILAPAIRVVRATPVVCFILLVYLWVARANIPGIISALMVLPVMWGNLDAGLRATDPQLLELARAYRFDRWKTARLIYLPSLRPYAVSGLMTATGLAWKSGVAAEVICPPKYAIGTEISHAKTALETPELFAWTLVIIALSLSLERLIRRLLTRKGAGV